MLRIIFSAAVIGKMMKKKSRYDEFGTLVTVRFHSIDDPPPPIKQARTSLPSLPSVLPSFLSSFLHSHEQKKKKNKTKAKRKTNQETALYFIVLSP